MSSPLAAQDIDIGFIAATARAASYPLGIDESRVTLFPAPTSTFLIRVGARLNFLERYDEKGDSLWRSPPLRLGECKSHAADCVYGLLGHGGSQIFVTTKKPQRVLFLTTSNDLGEISAKHPAEVTLLAGDGTRLRQALANSVAEHDLLEVAAETGIKLGEGKHLVFLSAPAAGNIAAAVAEMRAKATLSDTDFGRLRQLFGAIDFRKVDLSVRDQNDFGYLLSRGGTCSDLADAIPILKDTLRRAPNRAQAHLNLGDTYAAYASAHCVDANRWEVLAAEQYRSYCADLLPAQPPMRTSRRLLAWLRESGIVSGSEESIDAEFCRPRLRLFDDLAANDLASLRSHVLQHHEDIGELNETGLTVLAQALNRRNASFVEALIAADALRFGYGSDNFHPLRQAILIGPEVLDLMLVHGVTDEQDRPLLTVARLDASSPGKVHMMKSLLRHGVSIDQRDDQGGVIAATASGKGPSELFSLLRDAGAKVNLPDARGQNAMFDVGPFDVEATKRTIADLHAIGVTVNQVDNSGWTPLSNLYRWTGANRAAVLAGTKLLLEFGADPNLSGNGETALTMAAIMGWPDHVALLLAHGAGLPKAVGMSNESSVDRILRLIADRDNFPADDAEGLRFTYRQVLVLLGQPVPPVPETSRNSNP